MFKNYSLAIRLLFVSFFLASCGDSPKDLLEEIWASKDRNKIGELTQTFKDSAVVSEGNFKGCRGGCEGEPTAITVSGLKPRSSSKFPFRGKVGKDKSKHGADMSIWNAKHDKSTGLTQLKIGSDTVTLTSVELSVTDFTFVGWFTEWHSSNHDVNGMIVDYKTDEAKLAALKEEQETKIREAALFNKKFPTDTTLAYFSDGSCRNSAKQKCVSKSDYALICSQKPYVTDLAHRKLTLTKPSAMRSFLKAGKRSAAKYVLSKDGQSCFVSYTITGIYRGSNHIEEVFGTQKVFYRYKNGFYAN